jgi:hypothetical protein
LEDESDGLQNIQTVSVTFLGEDHNPSLLPDVLMALGFTATGIAAQWVSSIAWANGVGVVSGSLYSLHAMLQSAMMGSFLLSLLGVGALFLGIVGVLKIRR